MAGGSVHVPWYATLFRGDGFEEALRYIAPVALRYGATDYAVYRSQDDGYRFLQVSTFPDKLSWERYWYGEEFIAWRADYSSWYQVPILYTWTDRVSAGQIGEIGEGEEPEGGDDEGVMGGDAQAV